MAPFAPSIERHLGEAIDIHGGGQDLIFPHHENEIAQGTCAHNGKLYCRYWLHNGFVTVAEEKMSKSLGNVLLVHDLLQEASGEAIRLVLLSSHYRQPLEWTDTALHQAKAKLDRLYGALRRLEDVVIGAQDKAVSAEFNEALEDDMNTPKALAELFQIAKLANTATEIEELRRLKGQLLAGGVNSVFCKQIPRIGFRDRRMPRSMRPRSSDLLPSAMLPDRRRTMRWPIRSALNWRDRGSELKMGQRVLGGGGWTK